MTHNYLPDFMRLVHTTRQSSEERNQYAAYQRLAAVYLLRLALGLQKSLKLGHIRNFFDDDLGRITGLDEFNSLGDHEFNPHDLSSYENLPLIDRASRPALLRYMRRQLTKLLSEGIAASEALFGNIRLLSTALKLSMAENEILVLRLLMPLLEVFRDTVTDYCVTCSMPSTVDYLRLMTTRPAREIRKALQPGSQLLQMGWLKIHPGLVDLENKLILDDGLLDILLREHDSAEALCANFFKPAGRTQLVIEDYAHLQNDLEVLQPYLRTALDEKQRGVNILIYGPPGVGKTQFAKLLAQTLNTPLYEVLCADQEGNVLRGSARFAACNLSQKMLSKRQASLLLFDEAEDVFPPRYSFFFDDDEDDEPSSGQGDKAWINQQLENNPVPVIWISNRTQGMDKAYLRRFSYSVEIDKMPASIRRRIVNKYSKGLKVDDVWREKLISQAQLTPAQIEQACSIAKAAQKRATIKTEQIAERVLEASMRLLKQKSSLSKTPAWTRYDRTFTNTDMDLELLLTGLQQNPRGSFCFYGAPGTGKTALARHIAETLGVQLHVNRASDLLDKYVGGSEKNIARLFADAQKQGGILLLDEADSLLCERSRAGHSWEITQVNEMLTQMEIFSGIFICTTNLMDKLDAASLRRFDFKVKFDYLRPEQRWALFQQESQRLGGRLPVNSEALAMLKQQLHRLTKLTPGDFAVVSRQAAVLGKTPEPERIIAVLEQECKAKGETLSQIGFVI
ncbi:ATPase [Candidatus Methylobacter favarea]|uniref:ATPase n=1 Tax=Candidatus Methylobacter favarea TaxID=2707345 RepID=A0A8S0WSH9_9GAMM|nr:ATP-binding protein [Candidatus Methylobacter favarea]CAA9892781.1 ATPase [Candidatus Methylobacter favarea]